jgi:hypothetical protein
MCVHGRVLERYLNIIIMENAFDLKKYATRKKNASIFPLYQPFINPLLHHSITPILQVRLTTSFDKERMTAVYQRR